MKIFAIAAAAALIAGPSVAMDAAQAAYLPPAAQQAFSAIERVETDWFYLDFGPNGDQCEHLARFAHRVFNVSVPAMVTPAQLANRLRAFGMRESGDPNGTLATMTAPDGRVFPLVRGNLRCVVTSHMIDAEARR